MQKPLEVVVSNIDKVCPSGNDTLSAATAAISTADTYIAAISAIAAFFGIGAIIFGIWIKKDVKHTQKEAKDEIIRNVDKTIEDEIKRIRDDLNSEAARIKAIVSSKVSEGTEFQNAVARTIIENPDFLNALLNNLANQQDDIQKDPKEEFSPFGDAHQTTDGM